LSWIQFNERVLEEAECDGVPLMERLRFLSIFAGNFDEFYRVRVGALQDRCLLAEKGSKSAARQLNAIFKATRRLVVRFDAAFCSISRALGHCGVRRVRPGDELSQQDRAFLKNCFEHDIAPILSPYIIAKNHPFPFLENGLAVVGVTLRTKNGGVRFGLIPLGSPLPEVVFFADGSRRFILTEDLILLFAGKLFHKFTVLEQMVFTVVRNADIDENEGLYDYDIDLRNTMSKLIERRGMLAPVMLRFCGENCGRLVQRLGAALFLKDKQMFCSRSPVRLGFVADLAAAVPAVEFDSLYYPAVAPRRCIQHYDGLIDRILHKDVLMACPFEDFDVLISLIEQAAEDSRVRRIFMTLYRVAHHSKIVPALMAAARHGKEVVCVVELRARFDEENNIDWSQRLQAAGCRVLFGLPMYKVHAKLLLIEMEGGRRVCAAGTGNFNESTARVYTDIFLMTAHDGIAADIRVVFDAVERGEFVPEAQHLLVSPLCLKPQLIAMIDGEIANKLAGKPAAVMLKLNSLTDRELIDKLYEASRAGVSVRMIVRGICCIIPGVNGLTENIEVHSIVGRYLEHSRIYAFGVGRARRYYISSADFMARNTVQRVEAAIPIYDRECRALISRILMLNFKDNVQARVAMSDGKYLRVVPRRGAKIWDCQKILGDGE